MMSNDGGEDLVEVSAFKFQLGYLAREEEKWELTLMTLIAQVTKQTLPQFLPISLSCKNPYNPRDILCFSSNFQISMSRRAAAANGNTQEPIMDKKDGEDRRLPPRL
jgi:hypothetical protein